MAAPSKLSDVTTDELMRELARREKSKGRLLAKRDTLAKQLADIDARLARLGAEGMAAGKAKAPAGKPPRKKARRRKAGAGRSKQSLADMLATVMSKDQVVSIKELAQAVTAAGYKSKSKHFDTIIGQALKKDGRFKKVGRGQYTLA